MIAVYLVLTDMAQCLCLFFRIRSYNAYNKIKANKMQQQKLNM